MRKWEENGDITKSLNTVIKQKHEVKPLTNPSSFGASFNTKVDKFSYHLAVFKLTTNNNEFINNAN